MFAAIPPAAAIPPPLPTHSRYGPVLLCLSGYKIEASAEEGVSAGDRTAAVFNDRYNLDLHSGAQEVSEGTWTDQPHDTLGLIKHFAGKSGFGGKPFAAYNLPGIDGGPNVMVYSRQFTGGDDDLKKLARIGRVDPAVDKCGAFGPPSYAGETPDTLYWSPVQREGPAFRCQNGIGYAVKPGERLRLYWGPKPDPGTSQLYVEGGHFGIRGPIDVETKKGRKPGLIASGYTIDSRPISSQHSELILSPPNNAAAQPFLRQIYIWHDNAQLAAARALAERMEFVSPKDKRCK